jgi:aminopeptidase N
LLLSRDSDAFNRWEAVQRLYERWIFADYENISNTDSSNTDSSNIDSNTDNTDSTLLIKLLAGIVCTTLTPILNDTNLAAAFKATLLNVPVYNTLADSIAHNLRPHALYAARESVINQLAQGLKSTLPILYEQLSNHAPYSPDSTQAGTRALRNTVLMLWLRTGDKVAVQHAQGQYRRTHNMTNRIAALTGLLQHTITNEIDELLPEADDFYLRFEDNDLVIDKWFALQATLPYVKISFIQTLLAHPAFKWTTPNRMRSVVFRVCFANPVLFHTEAGYDFWLNSLEQLIGINPDIAARLARAMDLWQRYEPSLAQAMHAKIQQALKLPDLPNGVAEILNKALFNKYPIE